ncbi:MAG: ABC transporter ATP-binding protein [Bacillota bacterium]
MNTATEPNKKPIAKTGLRIIGLLTPYWGRYVAVLCLMLVAVVGEMIPPYLTKLIIDRGIIAGNLQVVLGLALAIIGVAVARAVMDYVKWVTSEETGQRIIMELRLRLHDHLTRLSHQFFAKMQTGQLMSRLTGDLEALHELVGFGALLIGQNVLFFVSVVIILLSLNWRLTLVTLTISPLLAMVGFSFNRRIRPAWEKVREEMAKLTTVLQENIAGVRVVKAFAREGHEAGRFSGRNTIQKQVSLARAKVESDAQPLLEMFSGLAVVILIWYGGREVALGRMTLGSLIAFHSYLWAIIWPMRMMGWLVNVVSRALAAAPRLFEILDTPPEVADVPGAIDLPKVAGHVVFENVTFAFKDDNQVVLSDINLEIKPGETVAIVGGTGSGKSTLINLLPRFFDPDQGRVLIDGYDIRKVTLASLRRQIGLVLQETFLFSARIKDNIAFGRPDATMTEIAAAARVAQAERFIESFPKKYDTMVGERGIGLSGGQKQRVALARAVLMDPSILILDEATASVDAETEGLIQDALQSVLAGRTTIIIAKRFSTVKLADKILVLDGGKIAGYGTHEELMETSQLYRRLLEGAAMTDQTQAAPATAGNAATAGGE